MKPQCNKDCLGETEIMTFDEEERRLRIELARILDTYRLAAKPIIDRLTAIEMSRPPRPFVLTFEQAQRIGIELPEELKCPQQSKK